MLLGNFSKRCRIEGRRIVDKNVETVVPVVKEYTRERVPLNWAMTQNNLGNALARLGERESGTTRLEEAVAAFREALRENTRERVPLAWAMTQSNLGNALATLGRFGPVAEAYEPRLSANRACALSRLFLAIET